MKARKTLLSLLLVLALCVSLVSTVALADDGDTVVEGGEAVAIVKNAASSVEKASLEEAVAAAQNGDTVILMSSLELNAPLSIEKDITLDLNGNTLRFTSETKQDAAILVKDAEVTIRNGKLKVESEDADAGFAVAVLAQAGADVALDELKLSFSFPGGTMLATKDGGYIGVYDGTYSNDPSAFLAPECKVEAAADGSFIVTTVQSEPVVNDPVTLEPTEEPTNEDGEEPKAEEGEEPKEEGEEPKEEGEGEKTEGEGEKAPGEGEEGGEKEPVKGSATGTDPLRYQKKKGLGGDVTYTVSPELEKVVVYSSDPDDFKELTIQYVPTNSEAPEEGGKVTIAEADNKAVFDALDAGAWTVEFRFKDADPAKVDLYVFLAATLEPTRHVKSSGKTITATLTDVPEAVLLSDSSDLSSPSVLNEGTDYTISGKTITFTAAFLDGKCDDSKEITKYLAFKVTYGDKVMAAPYAITLAPAPSIDPTETVWKVFTLKTFVVKPDVQSVSIDGNALKSDEYSVSGNDLTLNRSVVAKLSRDVHTLTVVTKDGTVTAKITVAPAMGYSDKTGNQHTKGGSKTIIFIASDPVKSVKVDGKELDVESYILSEDKTTITLKAAYLNTLAEGNHTITTVVTANGKDYELSSSFKIISSGAAGGYAPPTGDSSPAIWVALLLMSGAALIAILPRLKRE
ncbi:MAG: hypothetical protein IK095_03885 [Oscillospiraceae bacterium]|nr:hypothetical protein [Oscillospiraceae bacterium]